MDVITYKGKSIIVSGVMDIVDVLIEDRETADLGELLRDYHKSYMAEISGHDDEIEDLARENDSLSDEIFDLENKIMELKTKIKELEAA